MLADLRVVSDPSDTVHKHFKQNSGKSEFVLREGSVAGKEASPAGEEKGDEIQADLYIHHVFVHFHRWGYVLRTVMGERGTHH